MHMFGAKLGASRGKAAFAPPPALRLRGVSLLAALLAALLAVAVGCTGHTSGNDAGLAAQYQGGVITEDEVNDYTAAYRKSMGYDDDSTWTQFLSGEGITAKEWREQAIAALVDERLMWQKAEELGITVDEEQVSSQIEADKAAVGVSDEDEWARYLEAHGSSPDDYRKSLESASIEQQVLMHEVMLDAVEDEDAISTYISKSLASRVVRRYRVLEFDSEQAAEAAIADLSALSGKELADGFDSWLTRDDSDRTTPANRGDIGWDIAYDLGSMQNELNEEMLAPNSLSAVAHESDGKYYVLLCTDRFEFHTGTAYSDLPDDDLKAYAVQAANYSYWSQLSSSYIEQLREDANVMVSAMPEGLPYDVDVSASSSASQG